MTEAPPCTGLPRSDLTLCAGFGSFGRRWTGVRSVGLTQDGPQILRAADPEFALRVPIPPLGARLRRPTNKIRDKRRKVAFITPIPRPKKQKRIQQEKIVFDKAAQALGTEAQQYDLTAFIGGVRQRVDRWRELRDPGSWQVTPETARLLQHWRSHRFGDVRPFFCQVEAVETAIWLTEVAPQRGREERQVLDHLDQASQEANPDLARLALKLATGAGKTMGMARSRPRRTNKARSRATTARKLSGIWRPRGSGSPGSKRCSGSWACNA